MEVLREDQALENYADGCEDEFHPRHAIRARQEEAGLSNTAEDDVSELTTSMKQVNFKTEPNSNNSRHNLLKMRMRSVNFQDGASEVSPNRKRLIRAATPYSDCLPLESSASVDEVEDAAETQDDRHSQSEAAIVLDGSRPTEPDHRTVDTPSEQTTADNLTEPQ